MQYMLVEVVIYCMLLGLFGIFGLAMPHFLP